LEWRHYPGSARNGPAVSAGGTCLLGIFTRLKSASGRGKDGSAHLPEIRATGFG